MAVYQSLTLTQLSQDPVSNTSQLHLLWESTQTGGSYNNNPRAATYWVAINGGTELTDTAACALPYRQTTALADVVLTIPHNEKGEAIVTVRTYMNTHISAGVVELSKTIELTKIPRASTLTASGGCIGGSSQIAVSKKQETYTHSIAYRFGQLTGFVAEDGSLTDTEAVMRSDSVQMQLPPAFYSQLPDAREGECVLSCRTYCDGAQVGLEQSCSFMVEVDEAACQPSVSGSALDINPYTVELTGDQTVLVKGESIAQCRLQAEAANEAAITHCFINGILLEEGNDSLIVDPVEDSIRFTATDSRGFTASVVSDNRVIPYFIPTGKATAVRTHPTDGSAVLTVEGTCYCGSFGAAENSLTMRYQIAQQQWKTVTVQPAEGKYSLSIALTDMDYTKVYPIKVQISDCLHTLEKNVILKKSVPVFDWGENDFQFHVPVDIEGGLSVSGKPVLSRPELMDAIYPVGVVFCGSAACNPGVAFGGVWQILSREEDICRWLRTA